MLIQLDSDINRIGVLSRQGHFILYMMYWAIEDEVSHIKDEATIYLNFRVRTMGMNMSTLKTMDFQPTYGSVIDLTSRLININFHDKLSRG